MLDYYCGSESDQCCFFCLTAEYDATVLTREHRLFNHSPAQERFLENILAPDSQDALVLSATALCCCARTAFSSEAPTNKD